jgi:hypothetical protein
MLHVCLCTRYNICLFVTASPSVILMFFCIIINIYNVVCNNLSTHVYIYIYIYIYMRVCVCVCVDISLTVFSYRGIWLQVEWPSFETYGTACLYVIVITYITWDKNAVVDFSLCVSTLLLVKVMLKHKVLKYNSSQKIFVCINSLRSVFLNLNLSYMIYLTKHIMENNLCVMISVLLISC